ncbi:MAG: winged helix-turn-helix domain-containing protein [Dehalococcoidia bacterium]
MPVVRISEELFKEIQKYAEPLVDNIETTLWKILKSVNQNGELTHVRSYSRKTLDVTPQKEFWRPILETLTSKGGTANAQTVVEGVESRMRASFKAGDYKTNADGTAKWVKAVHFQRLSMVHQGLIDRNSPRGVWQITEKGRQWLLHH